MQFATWSSSPAISCSWAATRLASIVVFLISFAFCFNFLLFLSTLFLFPQFLFFLSFCCNFSSFSFNSFFFPQFLFFFLFVLNFLLFPSTHFLFMQFHFSFLPSRLLQGSFWSSSLLPGIAVKVSNPPIIIYLLLLTYLTLVYTINKIWWAHPLKQKTSYLNKKLKALSHQELRRQSGKQFGEGR